MDYKFPYRNRYPTYNGEKLDDVLESIEQMGYKLHFADMRTTIHTTKHKMHGVYVIIFKDGDVYNLLSGTYNYLCILEGKESVDPRLEAEFNVMLQADARWSLWDNPMRDRREEAWNKMWQSCRTFTSERDLKEYIIVHMKNWEDVGNTLAWARRAVI